MPYFPWKKTFSFFTKKKKFSHCYDFRKIDIVLCDWFFEKTAFASYFYDFHKNFHKCPNTFFLSWKNTVFTVIFMISLICHKKNCFIFRWLKTYHKSIRNTTLNFEKVEIFCDFEQKKFHEKHGGKAPGFSRKFPWKWVFSNCKNDFMDNFYEKIFF